jgi:hypothetical protein
MFLAQTAGSTFPHALAEAVRKLNSAQPPENFILIWRLHKEVGTARTRIVAKPGHSATRARKAPLHHLAQRSYSSTLRRFR